jgi:hypothetical protein
LITGVLSPGIKLQRLEAENSPPAGAEVKKIWFYTSNTPYASLAKCIVKHRNIFTLLSWLEIVSHMVEIL